MSEATARVYSIDSIRAFKAALLKFAETADVALSSAEGQIHRTRMWLQLEQLTYWQSAVRKRTEEVTRCKDAVRQKLMYRDSTGRTPEPVEERKALKIAVRRLEEAEQKLANTKRWIRQLEREYQSYKGSVQRFATAVQHDIPRAAERLDRAHGQLEAYVSMTAPSASAEGISGSADQPASMARPEAAEVPEPSAPPAAQSSTADEAHDAKSDITSGGGREDGA